MANIITLLHPSNYMNKSIHQMYNLLTSHYTIHVSVLSCNRNKESLELIKSLMDKPAMTEHHREVTILMEQNGMMRWLLSKTNFEQQAHLKASRKLVPVIETRWVSLLNISILL